MTWQGSNIVVLNQVTITPPYKPENVKGHSESKAYTHIKKVVSLIYFLAHFSFTGSVLVLDEILNPTTVNKNNHIIILLNYVILLYLVFSIQPEEPEN